jgi:hypothetical protein
MKPLDRLSDYLGVIERRLRILAWTRGAAITAVAALALTVLAVLVANKFAFSDGSVLGARLFLFLGLALAIAAALVIPVIRLNRRHAARRTEGRFPQFEERLLTFAEKLDANPADPFLPLLADDALAVAHEAHPASVARTGWIFSFSSAAVAAVLVLLWLATSGPGFLGYGASLLWAGLPKGDMKPFYAIQVDPGNRTIRKRADQLISAQLKGFTAPRVRFVAKYASGSQWEQVEMRTEAGSSSYQFLIAGVPESLEYYVEAGGVRSPSYKLTVVDLPAVKRIRVTYHYPGWAGMKDAVEDPGGDLRAVEGTTGEVAVETDRPLSNGILMLDDGSKIYLRSGAGGMLVASVPIEKDGMYHVAAIENAEDVRLSEDYFIEAMKDRPPEVKIVRPGRDFRASPIEEVTVAVDARDDFGLRSVELRYSVNGGAEKSVPLMQSKDGKTSSASTVIALEDFKVEPGDIVSLYAIAKDARQSTKTDMFFIEAQPFERNYTQSQQDGGDAASGGDDDQANQQDQISKRQKEIITATWNQAKGQGAKGTDAENAAFLSQVQSKLKDQARSLADRMKARQLEEAGDAFKTFVDDMEKAAAEMQPASDKLKGAKWQDALAPEQRALQYLLRAEATFRDIQVAFGRQGGGGGGGGANGATRDLEGLFDLELDTEKNQYEGARQNQSADQRQRQVDEAMQKLQDLARRQQELAEQQRRDGQQTAQQRWQQEQLRREAEQLRQQMEQLQRGGQEQLRANQQGRQQQNGQQQNGQQQNGQQQGGQQQGGQQQGGRQGQQTAGGRPGQPGEMDRLSQMAQGQGQAGQQSGQQPGQQQRAQQNQRMQNADAAVLNKALEQLQQSLDDMRNANSSMQLGSAQAQAAQRRAADRLKEAGELIAGMKGQQASNQVDDVVRQAGDLARRQQEFEGQMRRAFANDQSPNRQQAAQLADSKDQEVASLKKLEQDMQNAARDLQSTERQASSRMRDALGNMQQQELARDMQRNSEWIRRGIGEYAVMSESQITAGLNQLRDELTKVQEALGTGRNQPGPDDKTVGATLDRLEQLRQMLQSAQQGMNGQRQPSNGQQSGQQQGGQQAAGQQSGGQQSGGQQAGGQQQGGQVQNGPGGQRNGGTAGAGGNIWNYGGPWGGPWNGQDYRQFYRDTLQNLGQLQQQFKDDPNTQRDIQNVIRDMRLFDPSLIANDPLLNDRIRAALANVEQVELELRRKVDSSTGGGTVRSPGNQPIPEGYLDAVAEYYRKLSQTKKQ